MFKELGVSTGAGWEGQGSGGVSEIGEGKEEEALVHLEALLSAYAGKSVVHRLHVTKIE